MANRRRKALTKGRRQSSCGSAKVPSDEAGPDPDHTQDGSDRPWFV